MELIIFIEYCVRHGIATPTSITGIAEVYLPK